MSKRKPRPGATEIPPAGSGPRRVFLPLVLGAALVVAVAGPSTGHALSPPSGQVVVAERVAAGPGGVARIGDRISVRSGRRIGLGAELRAEFARSRARHVGVRATRRAAHMAWVPITDAVRRLLRIRDGRRVATLLRVRLVINGRPGPWTSRARSPIVAPAAPDPPSPPVDPVPPILPTPDPPPTTPAGVLGRGDFDYLGAFKMPTSACGWSTAYGSSGLAVRRVDGGLRFFSGAHVYGGGLIYEVAYPGVSANPAAWPEAPVVAQPCDIYQGRKRLGAGAENRDGDNWTHGLYYDVTRDRLYWSFGHPYNADASNDNVLGYTDFSRDAPRAYGPWRTANGEVTHSQRVRGGTLAIPASFADRYLGGRSLGVGFGGYYSIIGRGSMGPTLYAIDPPGGNSGTFDPLTLLEHPADLASAQQWAPRPTNYWIDPNLNWALSPAGDRGYWTPGDSIEGAAVWIEEPDRRGLIFFPQLSRGRIAYENGGVQTEGDNPYWYVYDPTDLAAVAQGARDPWDVTPAQIVQVEYPSTGTAQAAGSGAPRRVTGAAYDPTEHRLYLQVLNGYQGEWEQYPLVHVFELRAAGG